MKSPKINIFVAVSLFPLWGDIICRWPLIKQTVSKTVTVWGKVLRHVKKLSNNKKSTSFVRSLWILVKMITSWDDNFHKVLWILDKKCRFFEMPNIWKCLVFSSTVYRVNIAILVLDTFGWISQECIHVILNWFWEPFDTNLVFTIEKLGLIGNYEGNNHTVKED